ADHRCRGAVAIGQHRKPRRRDTTVLARGGSGLSRRGRHIPRVIGGRTPALAIRVARGNWRRYHRLRCRGRGCAVGAKGGWRAQSGLRLVPVWNRRPRRGDYDGGNDLAGAGAPPSVPDSAPPPQILSAVEGPDLRRPAGPDPPRARSVAVATGDRLDRPAGRGLMPLASSTAPGRAARFPPSPVSRSRDARTA